MAKLAELARGIKVFAEGQKPPVWLPVTDVEGEEILRIRLAKAWQTYHQSEPAQDIVNRLPAWFNKYNDPHKIQIPTLAVLGEKPLSIHNKSSASKLAIVIRHSDPYSKSDALTQIIYGYAIPHAHVVHSLINTLLRKCQEDGQTGTVIPLDIGCDLTIKINTAQRRSSSPIPTFCPIVCLPEILKLPQGTIIVPENPLLVILSPHLEPHLWQYATKQVTNMEDIFNKKIFRHPIAFLWAEHFIPFATLSGHRFLFGKSHLT